MPLAFYICAAIAALFLIFYLAQIVSRLYDIHIDLCHIHEDLVPKENPVLLFNNKNKPAKKREYWLDRNGFKHWRKKKDA
mgnify:CR=1 FL=1